MDNFHGNVAVWLEHEARLLMNYSDRPIDTIFDADNIECESFSLVLMVLALKKQGYILDPQIKSFLKECAKHFFESGRSISEEDVLHLTNQYKSLNGEG